MKIPKYTKNIILLITRVGLGISMLTHGYPKLINLLEFSSEFADPFGIGPTLSLALTVFSEFLCSLLITLGLWTRWALIPLLITMLTAAFIIHGGDPFGKKEMAIIYAIAYLLLFITGPGDYSIDHLRKK